MACSHEEFAEFYGKYRCKDAPVNPGRVFRLAKRIYDKWDESVTWYEFVSVLYYTLFKLFPVFDPTRYSGRLPIEDHFMNVFAKSLRRGLYKVAYRWRGKRKFRPYPDDIYEPPPREYWTDEDVRNAVDRLPVRERQAIRSRYWDKLTNKEIARRLGVAPSAVQSYIKRGHERLRERLSQVF